MKKILWCFCLVWAVSCTNDDAPGYDPQQQLLDDIAAIEAHLQANNLPAEQDDRTGLYYHISQPGSGANPESGDVVTVNYRLFNFQGELLDTNEEQAARDGGIFMEGRQYGPFEVDMGFGQVIPGFERALALLQVEAEGIFYIPSVLAYANVGTGRIGPNENIIFEITLLTVD